MSSSPEHTVVLNEEEIYAINSALNSFHIRINGNIAHLGCTIDLIRKLNAPIDASHAGPPPHAVFYRSPTDRVAVS